MKRKGSGMTSKEFSDHSTAFCIYLLDCGYVLFFGDRPRVAPYELRHSLPAHEHVYEARTAFEWQIAFTQTNQAEYPVLLEMLLSSQVERHPSDISVMGNFLLLHGIKYLISFSDFKEFTCISGHHSSMSQL